MLDYFPSKFEGKSNDDAAAHWLEIRDYWAAHNTPPNRRAETFKLSLKGKARKWIEGKVFNNEQEMKVAFIEHFNGVHGRTATSSKIYTERLQPGETIDDLVSRLRPLTDSLGYNNQMIMDILNKILPQDLRF